MSTKSATKTPNDVTKHIRIPEALATRLEDASNKTGLKSSDVMRLALDRGLDRLLEQLAVPAASNAA